MTFTAEDCGGAIKENKIDIFMGSEQEAYNWSRRTIDTHRLNQQLIRYFKSLLKYLKIIKYI